MFMGVLLLGSILLSSTFEDWQVSPVSTGSGDSSPKFYSVEGLCPAFPEPHIVILQM